MRRAQATTPHRSWSTAALASVVAAGGATALTTHGRAIPGALVVISEVTSDDDDRIELHNAGIAPANLAGWSVVDSDPSHAPYALPHGTTLAPGAYLVLTRGKAHDFGLGTADGLMLRDAHGNTVDITSWHAGAASPSWCRLAASGVMVTCESTSFGGPNADIPQLAVAGHD
jgi:hypothetical protein